MYGKRPQRLPTVLTPAEVVGLQKAMHGAKWLMAMLLYGAGLRLAECLTLRMKDTDFSRNEIVVRERKGKKHRVTLLPTVVGRPRPATSSLSASCTPCLTGTPCGQPCGGAWFGDTHSASGEPDCV